jgi:hypothetical protein
MRLWTVTAFLLFAADTNAADLEARIRDLESRLAKAEALLAQLTSTGAPAIAPSIASVPAPVPAPEVERAQRQPMQSAPQELLPTLGQIGAGASFSAGVDTGAYGKNRGSFFGGAVELPLLRLPGGRLLYEFSAGLSRSRTNIRITSNVAQVANLAVLGPGGINDAIAGTGAAPFPVNVAAQSNVSLLQVSPFTMKYKYTGWDRFRLRPYVTVGFATYVTISNQTTATGLRSDANLSPELRAALQALFGTGAPFGGALIGGQIAGARELTERGIPSGQGGIRIGLQTGGGIEWRVLPRFTWGIDARWNRLDGGATFWTIAPRGTLRF